MSQLRFGRAQMVLCWSSYSPGSIVITRRRWRKRRKFATLTEDIVYHDWLLAMRFDDVIDVREVMP